jgi:hypothetical protein
MASYWSCRILLFPEKEAKSVVPLRGRQASAKLEANSVESGPADSREVKVRLEGCRKKYKEGRFPRLNSIAIPSAFFMHQANSSATSCMALGLASRIRRSYMPAWLYIALFKTTGRLNLCMLRWFVSILQIQIIGTRCRQL